MRRTRSRSSRHGRHRDDQRLLGLSIIKLNGADYVTIDGSADGGGSRDLTIQNTSAATGTAAIWLASLGTTAGATYDTIKNVNVRAGSVMGGTTTNIFGIFAGGAAVATNGDNNDYLTVQNNQIDSAYEGIAVRVATVLNGINNGLTINGNMIGSANAANYVQFRGIELIGAVAPVVTQNEIYNLITTTISANIAGIELGSTVYYGQVTRNKIHDLVNNNTGQWGAFGIYASSSTSNFSNSLVNNALWGITTYGFSTTTVSFDAVGIRLLGGAGYKVYFNSVLLCCTKTIASNSAGAFGRKLDRRAGSISATTCSSTRSPGRRAARPTPPG